MTTRAFGMIAVILAIAVGAFFLSRRSYLILLDETQLQARLDALFPLEKDYLFVIRVVLTEPDLRLVEGSDRIDFGVRVALNVGDLSGLAGRARLSGSLRYDPTRGAFFLDRAELEQLSVEDLPELLRERAEGAVAAVSRQYFDRYPIHRLQRNDLEQVAARLVLKDVRVVGRQLRLTLGY